MMFVQAWNGMLTKGYDTRLVHVYVLELHHWQAGLYFQLACLVLTSVGIISTFTGIIYVVEQKKHYCYV